MRFIYETLASPMYYVLARMKRHFPMLNRKPYTFDDVVRLAKRERIKITVCDYNEDILGYYCTRKTPKRLKKYVVLNEGLDEATKTFVGLHEIAHYFLHIPPGARDWHYCRRNARLSDSKNDCEADTFALIAMIPLPLLLELNRTPYTEIAPEMVQLCLRRKRIYELHEI